jgi:protein tyrosine phosphatase (PTP) superfamily phosphohydrolase (DUF442 family)
MRGVTRFTRILPPLFLCFAAALVVHAQVGTAPAQTASLQAAGAAQRLPLAGVHNAARVSDVLFRGAQPDSTGYDQLKNLGINFVVDLRNHGRDAEREQHEVESRGMHYVGIPSSGTQGPTLEQIAQFLLLIRSNPGQKVFVHCKRGADRTGVMVAAYRMASQHWSAEQARTEMLDFHAYHFLFAMARTVRDFPRNYETDAAFAAVRLPLPAGTANPAAAATPAVIAVPVAPAVMPHNP